MNTTDKWNEELETLASIINTLPLQKIRKWGTDVYTFDGKNILSFGGFKHFFSIWFFNGVFIDDKYNVLNSASESYTVSQRQWRFTSATQIDEAKIKEYIYQAIEIEKKGLKLDTKTLPPVLPDSFLKETFEKDNVLKSAFDKLTPGRQKEYIIYINEAKQEKTKQSRIDKITPLVRAGKGLNDKYR